MSDFVWSDEYSCNIRPIDNDHRTLFEAVADLDRAVQENHGEEAVALTIDSLLLYVREHFEREERYMLSAGYPDFRAHQISHRRFTQIVKALRDLYAHDPKQIDSVAVLAFLKDWLVEHILNTDRDYVPYLTGQKAGLHGEIPVGEVSDPLTTLTVTCPEEDTEVLKEAARILIEGGRGAEILTAEISELSRQLRRNALAQARKLFGRKSD